MKNIFSILLIVAVVVVAAMAEAQQPTKVPRIGYLTAASPSAFAARIEAFRQGLRELGYVEGKNIVIEWRYAEGKLDRLPALAAELVRLKVDVIVTGVRQRPVPPRKQLTRFPSSWRRMLILLAPALSPAWRDPAEISLDCRPSPRNKRKTTGASEGDRS